MPLSTKNRPNKTAAALLALGIAATARFPRSERLDHGF
jgi:hypothetical protein